MEKRADTADISVLFFFGCANICAKSTAITTAGGNMLKALF